MKNIYEGFNAYKLYLAVKNHFTTNYDFFKYNGKVNAKEDSFLKRRDKFFFAKLQRKYNNDQLRETLSTLVPEYKPLDKDTGRPVILNVKPEIEA